MPEITTLPYAHEVEQALLGSLMIEPELLSVLDIRPTDFYIERNRDIYMAMDRLRQRGQAVDYITICEELKTKLDDIGGGAYITGLLTATVTSAHAEEYARIIREKARRRVLLQIANDIAKTAYNESANIDTALPVFLEGLSNAATVRGGAVPISEVLSRLYDEIRERYANPVDIWGIKSGFPGLDRVTGGLQQTELMYFSGIPGVGKSMLAMQMAAQMGENDPGAIYSIEMSATAVARRMVSGRANVQTRSMKTGRVTEWEWKGITETIAYLEKLPVFMSDSAGWTTTSLRADLARLKARHGIKWFVLDYLYLLNDGAGMDEIERTSMASKGLKRCAKELELAGVAVHSMNKAGMSDKGIPSQEMLRGSGQVVYDADIITFLSKYDRQYDPHKNSRMGYVKAEEEENLRMLWFGKGRELETTTKVIKFVKNPGYPMFREVEEEAK